MGYKDGKKCRKLIRGKWFAVPPARLGAIKDRLPREAGKTPAPPENPAEKVRFTVSWLEPSPPPPPFTQADSRNDNATAQIRMIGLRVVRITNVPTIFSRNPLAGP